MNKEITERIQMIKEGNIPEGYKKSDVGIIPREWNTEKLLQYIISLNNGTSVNAGDRPAKEGEIGVLKTSSVTINGFKPNENKVVLNSENISNLTISPEKENLIIVRKNTPELVGLVNYIDKDYENIFLPDLLWQTVFKEECAISKKYIYYFLNTDYYNKLIKVLATGSSKSMPNIRKENFLNILICVPSNKEQDKITNILSNWDKVTEFKQKLLQEKQKQKQGLMERLLIGKVRLSGFNKEWKAVQLGSVLDTINKDALDNPKAYNLLTVKLHVKGIEATDKKPSATEKGRPYYLREPGELLIGRQNFHNGGIGIVPPDMKGYIASNAITSLEVIKGDLNFYFYYLSNTCFYKRIDSIIGGTGQKEISETILKKLKITIPTEIEEQKQISTILRTADKEVDLLKKEIEALKEQKKGLMQLLLTGIVRV